MKKLSCLKLVFYIVSYYYQLTLYFLPCISIISMCKIVTTLCLITNVNQVFTLGNLYMLIHINGLGVGCLCSNVGVLSTNFETFQQKGSRLSALNEMRIKIEKKLQSYNRLQFFQNNFFRSQSKKHLKDFGTPVCAFF